MKKKIGTLMEQGLIGEAKIAALKENIPFHRLIERALEGYLKQRRLSGIEERTPEYKVYPPSENSAANSELEIARNPLAGVTISLEERRKRVLSLAGKFHSGHADIAKRHDEFFVEACKE